MSDLWTYNAAHRKRPNVHPLRTPSGVTLTRDAPEDHPWHHGLWFTIKFVNEENFWEEYDTYGVLRHVDDHTVHWIRPDRETVVIVDKRTLAHVDLGVDDKLRRLHGAVLEEHSRGLVQPDLLRLVHAFV